MPNANLRILVIEDNRDLATEIVDFLASGGNTVESALDGITGKFTSDDLLGEIFGRFCIGK